MTVIYMVFHFIRTQHNGLNWRIEVTTVTVKTINQQTFVYADVAVSGRNANNNYAKTMS